MGYSVLFVAVTGSVAFFLNCIFRHPRRTGFTVLCFLRYGDCDLKTKEKVLKRKKKKNPYNCEGTKKPQELEMHHKISFSSFHEN